MKTADLIKIKAESGVSLTDRELAIRWWSRLSETEQVEVITHLNLTLQLQEVTDDNAYWMWSKRQKL